MVLLLVVQIVASPILTRVVNAKLAQLPGYDGHVEAVKLTLWNGGIAAREFTLAEKSGEATKAIVTVKNATLSVALWPLVKGRIGGNGKVSDVVIRMVKAEKAETAETKNKAKKNEIPAEAARKWQTVLQESFPLEITRFEIENGSVEFEDQTTQPSAKIKIEQFNLVATDVSNRPKGSEDLPAKIHVDAVVGGSGKLVIDVKADPSQRQPRFHAQMEVKGLELVPIHDFLLAYALIDVRAGHFELFSEVDAAWGAYDGYIKPFFTGLEFKAVSDPERNFVQNAATKVASAVTDLLKNEKDQVATRAPFKGNFADNQIEVWTAIENLLRNAFVQALREGLEG